MDYNDRMEAAGRIFRKLLSAGGIYKGFEDFYSTVPALEKAICAPLGDDVLRDIYSSSLTESMQHDIEKASLGADNTQFRQKLEDWLPLAYRSRN